MTGVSLRCERREYLALPGGVAALRAGHTGGLPLLAPWINRLGSRRYRAAGVDVDLRRYKLHTDDNGLPIHGLLVGWPDWEVTGTSAARRGAPHRHHDRRRARVPVPAPARDRRWPRTTTELVIDTMLVPTGDRKVPGRVRLAPVPAGAGHAARRAGRCASPREHLALDELGIPTGASEREPAEDEPIGRRTFDDLYALGRDRRLAFTG